MAFLAGAEEAARQPKQAAFHGKRLGGCFRISGAFGQSQIREISAERINAPGIQRCHGSAEGLGPRGHDGAIASTPITQGFHAPSQRDLWCTRWANLHRINRFRQFALKALPRRNRTHAMARHAIGFRK